MGGDDGGGGRERGWLTIHVQMSQSAGGGSGKPATIPSARGRDARSAKASDRKARRFVQSGCCAFRVGRPSPSALRATSPGVAAAARAARAARRTPPGQGRQARADRSSSPVRDMCRACAERKSRADVRWPASLRHRVPVVSSALSRPRSGRPSVASRARRPGSCSEQGNGPCPKVATRRTRGSVLDLRGVAQVEVQDEALPSG